MTKTNERPTQTHNTLRKRVATYAGALIISGGIVGAAIEGGKNYGYHPGDNPPAPNYLHTQQGIDPAGNVQGDGSK